MPKPGLRYRYHKPPKSFWYTSLRLIFFYVSLNVSRFKVITFVSTYRRLWVIWNKDGVNCGKANLNEDMNPNDRHCGNCNLSNLQINPSPPRKIQTNKQTNKKTKSGFQPNSNPWLNWLESLWSPEFFYGLICNGSLNCNYPDSDDHIFI